MAKKKNTEEVIEEKVIEEKVIEEKVIEEKVVEEVAEASAPSIKLNTSSNAYE